MYLYPLSLLLVAVTSSFEVPESKEPYLPEPTRRGRRDGSTPERRVDIHLHKTVNSLPPSSLIFDYLLGVSGCTGDPELNVSDESPHRIRNQKGSRGSGGTLLRVWRRKV